MLGPRITEEVLILRGTPQERTATLEWRPFKQGNTLGEIVTAHNLRCNGLLREKTPKPFSECLREIGIALTIASPPGVNTFGLASGGYGRIKILMVELDADHDPQVMQAIKTGLAQTERLVHLVQFSNSSRLTRWPDYFTDLACLSRSEPEVFQKQADLEKFLHSFREAYEQAWFGVLKNPLDAPCLEQVSSEPYIHPRRTHFLKPRSDEGRSVERVYRNYRRTWPSLLTGVRDVALARRLPEEQVINLGRSAAIQELLLSLIAERTRPYPGYPVSVESIRMPLYGMPSVETLEMRDLQETELICLHLKDAGTIAADTQPDLTGLGFTAGVMAAVHFDHPELWEKVEPLKELLRIDSLRAELPAWRVLEAKCRVGLNEIAFGLHIEESIEKPTEIYSHNPKVENPTGFSFDKPPA